MPPPNSYEEITKELYSKNVDLVNANKTLELIQRLYEIMIDATSVESVSQRFIDVVTQTLGFTDGIVFIKSEVEDFLRVVGITQTQVNNTILELARIPVPLVKLALNNPHNALVRAYLGGRGEILDNPTDIWTPYIKPSDSDVLISSIQRRLILVYPILFGSTVVGSFCLVASPEVHSLTEFEKKALDRVVTVFGIAIDRIRINAELHTVEIRELEKTKELLKLKDEFVFIATHDLKTPVTAISGFVKLIDQSNEAMSAETKDSFDAIKDASARLNQLTNDLLQVARNESNTIVVDLTSVDIFELIQNAVNEVTPPAKEKGIDISQNLNPNYKFVEADKAKLYEVIENLLSNAVKYNKPSGRVTISTDISEDKNHLKVSVSDTGFGIPKESQSKIFQKFFRARQKGTEEVPGTGLGLFVVRMLIEKMGGTITFTSDEGIGTTFIFTLALTK